MVQLGITREHHMKTFRFIVPKNDNGGTTLVWAHHQFQAFLVNTYGGFTETECKGQWRDDAGKLYIDASIAYDVALGNHPSTVINKLCELFPDQKSFAMLELGEMTFNDAAPQQLAPSYIRTDDDGNPIWGTRNN